MECKDKYLLHCTYSDTGEYITYPFSSKEKALEGYKLACSINRFYEVELEQREPEYKILEQFTRYRYETVNY